MLQASLTGPTACGLMFAFGEGQSKRSLAGTALPAEAFRSRNGASPTRRCLLDCFALFTRPGTGELAFCYVDSRLKPAVPSLRTCAATCRDSSSFRSSHSSMLRPPRPVWARCKPSSSGCCREDATGSQESPILIVSSLVSGTANCLRNVNLAASIGSGSMRCAATSTVFLGDISPKCSRARRTLTTRSFASKSPRRRCPTDAFLPAFCPKITTYSNAPRGRHEGLDEPRFGERSKKGPFTSVSTKAFTKDSLQSPSTRAIRPSTWRMDPCFGVRGGAGATPVSVGCAATNPFRPRCAPTWVTPAPPLPRVNAFRHANRIAD